MSDGTYEVWRPEDVPGGIGDGTIEIKGLPMPRGARALFGKYAPGMKLVGIALWDTRFDLTFEAGDLVKTVTFTATERTGARR
ncbi:MAG TPA: hypothetical protein VGH15_05775 [Caulobacteraceae bacterium]|jgi:hypothetical protein